MSIQRITHLNGKITYRASIQIKGGASKTMEFASAKEARKWLAEHGEKLTDPGQQTRHFVIGVLSVLAVFTSLYAFGYRYFTSPERMVDLVDANPNYTENPDCTVLFVGNSHLYTYNVPNMVGSMSRTTPDTSDDCPVEMMAEPSYTLADHWQRGEVQKMIMNSKYGSVVLQEQSWVVLTNYNGNISRDMMKKMTRAIRNNNMRPILMETWPHQDDAPIMLRPADSEFDPPKNTLDMAIRIHDFYNKFGKEIGVDVSHVGDYWNYAHFHSPGLELYSDEYHASMLGAYLAALVLHKTLYNSDPLTITYVPEGVSKDDAEALREYIAMRDGNVRPNRKMQ